MAESETQPLLVKENKDTTLEDIDNAKSRKGRSKCGIITGVVIVACIVISAAIGGTVAFGVKFALYKNNNSECQKTNHSPIKGVQIRSGSYSILDTITSQDLMCYVKPQLLLSLEDRDSSVEVYQTLCQNIETQPFRVNYHFIDLPSAEGPRSLFDENFSSQNYFMNGNVQVEIINATTTFPSMDIDLCLFFNHYEYNSFLRAGIKWKNHTESATCVTMTAAKNGEHDDMVLFNISEPTFAFLGLATTNPVQIDLINITAIGQDISSLGENSTKVCELNGEVSRCNLSLQTAQLLRSQNTCIVAYEEGNPDGTYSYSNLTISTPNQVIYDNPYKKKLTIYGFTSLGVIVIILTPFMLILIVSAIAIIRKKILRRRNNSTVDHEQHSIQSAQVTCHPIEDTTRHDPKAERPLMSVTGIEQILQKSQNSKHQSLGEGISGDQDVASHGRSGPISVGLEESSGQRACTSKSKD